MFASASVGVTKRLKQKSRIGMWNATCNDRMPPNIILLFALGGMDTLRSERHPNCAEPCDHPKPTHRRIARGSPHMEVAHQVF